jgi:hypothetical protein
MIFYFYQPEKGTVPILECFILWAIHNDLFIYFKDRGGAYQPLSEEEILDLEMAEVERKNGQQKTNSDSGNLR